MEVSLLPSEYTVKVTPEDNPLYLPQEFPLCVSVDPDEIGCVTLEQRDSLFALPQGCIFRALLKMSPDLLSQMFRSLYATRKATS